MNTITIINILMAVLAGLAIILSIIGIVFSRKSIEISENALKVSQASAVFQTRPWITISVIRQKETNRYYDIVKEENSIIWNLSFEIENIGNSPATNLRFPNLINLRDNTTVDETHFITLDNIILGQGKKYQYDFKMAGDVKPGENIDTLYNRYKENDKGMQFTFVIFYKGILDKEIEYKTKTVFTVNADTVSMGNGSEAT